MEAWKEEYKKLNIIDKIRFHWRVRQGEKLEDKRQRLEGDDRQSIDRMKIARDLRTEGENRINGVKKLKEPENKMEKWKVPEGTVKSGAELAKEMNEKVLDNMLGRELKSKEDAYENIIEMQRFLNYPHDNIPNALEKITQKYEAIQNILGSDILEKGMQIAQEDANLISMSETISVQDRAKMKMEILKDPKLAATLTYLRYNPEESKKQTGEIVGYQAVYASIIAEMKDKQNREPVTNTFGKSLDEQLMEMQKSQGEIGEK